MLCVVKYYYTWQLCSPVCWVVQEKWLAFWDLMVAPLAPCHWLNLGGKETQDFLTWEACENTHVDEHLMLNQLKARDYGMFENHDSSYFLVKTVLPSESK